jgi:choline-phosphate cytidylyltransferase
MDSSAVLSDDDYDLISNPGNDAFESNSSFIAHEFLTLQAPPTELPAFEDAQDKFETTRWAATEIQAFVRQQIASTPSFDNKRIRVYVDGTFDTFNVR